jgi:hypothetical protein
MLNIVSILIFFSLIVTVEHVIIGLQVWGLRRVLRSRGWTVLFVAYASAGLITIWRLLRAPILIIQAQMKGQLPDSLTLEQWITILTTIIIVLGGWILGFSLLRKSLRDKLGI